jgi:hypothetical protein
MLKYEKKALARWQATYDDHFAEWWAKAQQLSIEDLQTEQARLRHIIEEELYVTIYANSWDEAYFGVQLAVVEKRLKELSD